VHQAIPRCGCSKMSLLLVKCIFIWWANSIIINGTTNSSLQTIALENMPIILREIIQLCSCLKLVYYKCCWV
jgi:hypothetical protein